VRIQFEVGGCPLHDGHGTTLAAGGAFDFHAAAIPAKHRVDEDARDRTQQAAIVGEPGAQGVGHGEDKLSQADARNHVSQKVERGGSHPTTHARGAERTRPATERDQMPLLAALAGDQGEASLKEPTAQVVLQLGADEFGQRRAREALLGGGEEGLQVLTDDFVQGALLGPATLVPGRTASWPDGIWRFGEGRGGTSGHPPWVSANRAR
jgi:hypothetical protein